jgi:hypothetical protein
MQVLELWACCSRFEAANRIATLVVAHVPSHPYEPVAINPPFAPYLSRRKLLYDRSTAEQAGRQIAQVPRRMIASSKYLHHLQLVSLARLTPAYNSC